MSISTFDLFSIGIGPSSSHTVGPMRAAKAFIEQLITRQKLTNTQRIKVELYGSLALTGHGHGTDKAVLNGLEGKLAETVDPTAMVPRMQTIIDSGKINLNTEHEIAFAWKDDFLWRKQEALLQHPNGMRFTAYDQRQNLLFSEVYFSIGGGFIATAAEYGTTPNPINVSYPFESAAELLALCHKHNLSIAELVFANEKSWHDPTAIKQKLLNISETMLNCIDAGCRHTGILPGVLQIPRRAPQIYERLKQQGIPSHAEDADIFNWINLYAIAVNEENAAGGRIVTAPTNGAAGIVPAVLKYFRHFHQDKAADKTMEYLLTAAAIAILYKKRASISGAEVGCQGEVGVASSMAAGALTAVLGGSIYQVENAAEIAMEHHLGMTCDPIGGLVQIPCIERNAMGAVKAVNAARLALLGDGKHHVSLDKVIATMKQTGADMMLKYKETSQGGLAVNLPEC